MRQATTAKEMLRAALRDAEAAIARAEAAALAVRWTPEDQDDQSTWARLRDLSDAIEPGNAWDSCEAEEEMREHNEGVRPEDADLSALRREQAERCVWAASAAADQAVAIAAGAGCGWAPGWDADEPTDREEAEQATLRSIAAMRLEQKFGNAAGEDDALAEEFGAL